MPEQRRGMIVRHGVHGPLEAEANEILRMATSAITRHSDKSDILTPWKEASRRSREVLVPSGTPDASLREGNFHKVLNPSQPHLNSVVPGQRPIKRVGMSGARIDGAQWDAE